MTADTSTLAPLDAFEPFSEPLDEPEAWRCYFETDDGLVLTAPERFPTVEEALAWGTLLLRTPAGFSLLDPDEEPVPASRAAAAAGVTVEPDDAADDVSS